MEYKYHLLKYAGPSSRLICPSCGRKRCFAPYVDKDNNIVGEEYGRCDHESSCGYVKYPPTEKDWREWQPQPQRQYSRPKPRIIVKPQPPQEPPRGYCTIPVDIVQKCVRTKPLSDFLRFLLTIFDEDTVSRLVSEYFIGVTKAGDTIFFQMDIQGRCRTGKVMKYNPETGHRIKDLTARTPITWVHSLLKQQGVLPREWELTQCLFGEHLLKKYPDKPVCLVEAEKTAVIASAIMPQCVWVAVGGKTQLGDKVEVLEGRKVIAFPDVDGYDKWVEKCSERPYLGIMVSDYLQKNATDEDKRTGADIADILIRWLQANPSYVAPKPESEPTPELYPDNPVMREVMKYISPQYWDEVNELIKDLDLELVGVTRNSLKFEGTN